MAFNSLQYAGFLAVVLALHWSLHGRARTTLLLVASYVFYGWWDFRFLGLLALSSLIDFVVGQQIADSSTDRARDRWLAAAIVANLGILGFFKYWGFFTESASEVTAAFGLDWMGSALEVVLPVGISFYTFQSMSYAIDIHRRQLEPCSSLLDYATFVAFFPQLVAGPIERASHLLPQIRVERVPPDAAGVAAGLSLIGAGLFRKVVIADTMAPIVADGFGRGASGGAALLGVYAFALQIYGDFAGYTSIARGSARLLGVDLMVNFLAPYRSRNPAEFWRRWHISLSSWLRDYLYVPLGGNRGGARRTQRNLLVVMLLGGLWHGAAWTFVAWGAIHGLLLAAHRQFAGRRGARPMPGPLAVLLMFHATCFAWVFFRAASIGEALDVLGAIVTDPLSGLALGPVLTVLLAATATLLLDLVVLRDGDESGIIRLRPAATGAAVGALAVSVVVFAGGTPVPFVYFQF